MVLREKQNGSYLFIGEAYVHGVMNGEAVHSTAEEQLQDIVLE